MSAKRDLKSKMQVTSFTDLFGKEPDESDELRITNIPVEELFPFKNHPFRVLDDEKMDETVESIKQVGILNPITVRHRKDTGYEIISGHRRKHAAELAGLKELPAMIKDVDDDTAIIIMVHSNIQREDLSVVEKARAYRMEFDARKHQGSMGGNTLKEMGDSSGESVRTIQRYVRLSYLIDSFMEYLESKKLGIRQGMHLSYLSEDMQKMVFDIVDESKIKVTEVQAAELKKMSDEGTLSYETAAATLIPDKVTQKRKVVLSKRRIDKLVPERYTSEEIENLIYELLADWVEKHPEK